jgi:hypothetical protein
MLLEQKIKINITYNNREWYTLKGYSIPNDFPFEIEVDVHDLQPTSSKYVLVKCDYNEDGCKDIYSQMYKDYTRGRKHIEKDCCNNPNCMKIKRKESMLIQYNVENCNQISESKEKREQTCLDRYGYKTPLQNEEIKEKGKQTNLIKYGVEYTSQRQDIQNKVKQTIIEQYGVENYTQTNEYKEKSRQTNLEKYGVKHYSQTDEYKERVKQTNMDKYGVEYSLQSKEIREKGKKTSLEKYGYDSYQKNPLLRAKMQINLNYSLYKNGTAPCSNQQRYLHNLLGGELNYPIKNCLLDIAFIDNKVYIEYNGTGHNLSVKLGDITEEEYKQKEINRSYYLKRQGWKRIQIISTKKDLLPDDNTIIKLINQAKKYLSQGHSWFEINIDEKKLKCSQFTKDYDFGELRKIAQKNIDNQKSQRVS